MSSFWQIQHLLSCSARIARYSVRVRLYVLRRYKSLFFSASVKASKGLSSNRLHIFRVYQQTLERVKQYR